MLNINIAVDKIRGLLSREFPMEQLLFGERLKNAREASGMSRTTMANRIGVRPEIIEKWENGEMAPRANRLQMLSSLLNVPLLWLLAGSQKVPDPTAGATKEEIMLQKIADMELVIGRMKSDLDELRILAEAPD